MAASADVATISPIVEEVLLSEVLTRVWTAVATMHDVHQNEESMGPVARSIFLGHQEARNRCLLAILRMQAIDEGEARRLNVLRQKCERWTDMLLANFPQQVEIQKLTFDPQRCQDFARDLDHEGQHHDAMQTLTMASLEATSRQIAKSSAANGELNRRIAAVVFACLPPEAFDPAGVSSVLWQSRMEQHTDSALDMVQELLTLECPPERR